MSVHRSEVRFPFGRPALVALLAGLLMVSGCGSDETEEASEWAVEEGALTLERNLLAGDDEEYFFGRLYGIDVRDDGRIYVADGDASHVKVLAPDGALQDTIGREGEGPGEFRRPSEVVLARGDSIYVLDGYWGRVSVFAPSGNFAYSFMARDETGGPRNMMVPEDGKEFYFSYSPGSRTIVQEDAGYAVRRARASGEVGDSLFTARPVQFAWRELDRGMLFMRVPFARGSHFAFGPEERIHYAWSDSLRVVRYTPEGAVQDVIEIPFEYLPVTEDEREEALGDRSGKDRALVEEKIPQTKPAFDHFVIDDEGRYWFGRPIANPDSTDWWVALPEEKRVVTGTLPSEVELQVVKNGQAYGRTTTADGAPVLVRYQVSLEH